MSRLRVLLSRVREWISSPRIERELDDEIRHHLDLLTAEFERRGASRDEARAAARRAFGGVDQTMEAVRDRRGFRVVDTAWRDLRLALRALAAAPAFTAAAVLTLGLGIGANTAIFTVVDAVMLRPLPYPDPGRLVSLAETIGRPAADSTAAPQRIAVAPANLADYGRRTAAAVSLAGFSAESHTLTGAGAPERVGAEAVAAGYFAVLGVQPQLGRSFRPDEMVPGADAVVVISERLWRTRLNRDPAVLGRTLSLDGRPATIVGVMPADFEAVTDYAAPVDLLVPLALPADVLAGRGEHVISVVGRLLPGTSLDSVRRELEQAAADIALAYPEAQGLGVELRRLDDDQVRASGAAELLLVLLGAVALILLTACANIASLLVVRSISRRRETAVRVALGATRARLLLHVAAESVVIALLGAAAGLLVGWLGTSLLVGAAPASIPRIDQAVFGGRTVAFAVSIACLSAIVFGMLPGLQVGRAAPADVLHASSRSIVGTWLARSRGLLLVGEVALSIVLLVGALLMTRSLLTLNAVPLGFNPTGVLAVGVSLPAAKFPTPDLRLAFFEAVEARVGALPGVEAVAFGNRLPLRGNWTSGLELEPRADRPPPVGPIAAGYQAVSAGYRDTFELRLVQGRWLETTDRQGTPPVAVVDEAFSRALLGGADPLGQRLRRSDRDPWVTIVGVVDDIRRGGRTAEFAPQVYVPAAQTAQYPLPLSDLAVRATGNARGLEAGVRDAIWAVDPDQPLTRINTLDAVLRLGQATREFQTWLFLLFAGLALGLAVVGIYGVVSYAVSQRTAEIGLRMALGAGALRILGWVAGQAVGPVAVGAGLGLSIAWGLSRYVESLLFGVTAGDHLSYLGATAIVTVVAVAASFAAGRRATRVDPASVLK